ncbi:D-lactate dehydrogenase (cytochrome) [Melghirimyces profundicolus]|uniref:D-lactate dehydrogenase (cytochrome) n=1 Tax=Melghirimyces profundicolus TaxID=1242148 RepID=A0A2T6BG64_9BACL|nr:D-lactate dehydrogenase (cytochrome) [Melghirimyces profundicolus]
MDLKAELQQCLRKDQVTDNETVRERHSRDESYHTARLPDVVVFPESREDVVRVMRFAHRHGISVVPFGVGSSLEGHVIPLKGGITLDFERMNRILEIRPDDFQVRVEPGVTRSQLNRELKKYGLFYPVDPGADATVGGMAATNASGTTSVRYGVTRDQVLELEVVLADGKVIRPGGSAVKSSSGYHLPGLFVGSEGTLGIFTEIRLKVHGIPEEVLAARASFPGIAPAVRAARAIQSAGIPVARMELVDARAIRQVNRHFQTHYPEQATLFLEFHGNEAGLQRDASFAEELSSDEGCDDFLFETGSNARARLWEARHHLVYAFLHGIPGKKQMVTDVCVPLSALSDSLEHACRLIEASHLTGAVFGHIGDGNYHALLMIDPQDRADMEEAARINAALVDHALDHGGTCTGEHGVGSGKIRYQRREHEEALDVMRGIKQLLDPKGILNPGKIFGEE